MKNVQLARTVLIEERDRIAESILSAGEAIQIGDEIISPEALDTKWKKIIDTESIVESISVEDLVESAMKDVLDETLDSAREMIGSEGSSGKRSTCSERPSDREGSSSGSLSDFAWDVARTVMKDLDRRKESKG
ncbi:hypothetical protein [Methanopyrus sp.]